MLLKDVPRTDDYVPFNMVNENRIHALAVLSRNLVEKIHDCLPFGKNKWHPAAGGPVVAMRPIKGILPRIVRCYWVEAGRFGWLAVKKLAPEYPPLWRELCEALGDVLTFYGWNKSGFLENGRYAWMTGKQEWEYLNAPRIPQELLVRLERAASQLLNDAIRKGSLKPSDTTTITERNLNAIGLPVLPEYWCEPAEVTDQKSYTVAQTALVLGIKNHSDLRRRIKEGNVEGVRNGTDPNIRVTAESIVDYLLERLETRADIAKRKREALLQQWPEAERHRAEMLCSRLDNALEDLDQPTTAVELTQVFELYLKRWRAQEAAHA